MAISNLSTSEKNNDDRTQSIIKPPLAAPPTDVMELASGMLNASSHKKMTMKLILARKHKKILGAEASKDTVDTIFSFLTLPLAAVSHILPGDFDAERSSLGNVYKSVQLMAKNYKQSMDLKTLLTESSGNLFNLLDRSSIELDSDDRQCEMIDLREEEEVVHETYPYFCPLRQREIEIRAIRRVTVIRDEPDKHVGYVGENVNYLIRDDLFVQPVELGALVDLRKGVKDSKTGGTDVIEVCYGAEEILKLLKESLESTAVLTNVFLRNLNIKND